MNSGSWWWTGTPGVLRFMGSQGSRTRLSNWSDLIWYKNHNWHYNIGMSQFQEMKWHVTDYAFNLKANSCFRSYLTFAWSYSVMNILLILTFYFLRLDSSGCSDIWMPTRIYSKETFKIYFEQYNFCWNYFIRSTITLAGIWAGLKTVRWWHPTPVLLLGKSHGWRSLVGCSPRGRKESDMTEAT